jgi:predicted secreted protein
MMRKEPLVTAEQNTAKTLDATAGDAFEITLWEDRTAGYSWTPRFDPAAFDLIADDYQRTVNVDTADYGRRTFTFLAKLPGEHPLVLEARVGWKFSAGNRRQYIVTIRPAAPHPATTR